MRKKTGNIQDRGTSFRIRYVDINGLRQSETYATRDEAERELAIRLGELASGLPVSSKPNTVLFGELCDDVVTDYEVNGYASASDIEARFRLHIIPVFGRMRASQITTAQIRTYIKHRQAAGAKTGTINRELEAIRHTFNLAIEGRKLLHMPHVPMLREDNVRTGFFTRDEVDRLCSHLKPALAAFVLFGFLTGWRYSEIVKLLWRNVDLEAGEIRIDVGSDKNRDGRMLPMNMELHGLLKSLTGTANTSKPAMRITRVAAHAALTPHVFNLNGQPIGAFRRSWNTACYRAGLPCILKPVICRGKPMLDKNGKPRIKVVKALRTFHDLRRSAAREFQRQGFTEGQIMRMCGWKTRSVFDRYAIVTDADIREKMADIDAKRAGKRTK